MIRVRATVRGTSLQSLQSRGHAMRSGAEDSAVCAVVSVLLKSLGTALVGDSGCHVTVDAPEPGAFDLDLKTADNQSWSDGVWATALGGLREAQAAWPNQLSLSVVEE